MNILLTGGLGYIGSYLYNRLSNNNKIIVLDNFSNNTNYVDKKDRYIDIIKGDIRKKKDIVNIIDEIDIIIHLAAQISVLKSIDEPIFDANNNICGTLNLLETVRKTGAERFIYISSAAVYGMPTYLPIDEKHNTNPISPYGLSKLTGERYSILYHDLYGLSVTCLRFFNVYGPKPTKNSYSGVITKFIENVKNNKDPIIFGGGNQTRDFIYIDDIMTSIMLTIKEKKSIGEVFNIGTGIPTKIKDLAKIIVKLNKKSDILYPKHEEARKGDIIESYADITKARKILRYEPKYSLEQGLRLSI